MPPSDVNAVRRYRRRILGWGALAAVVLIAVGAPIYVDRVEADLERRVGELVASSGAEGVTVSFDGQQGSLRCETPLADPEDLRLAAEALRGVATVDVDRSCRVGSDGGTAAPASAGSTPPATSGAATTIDPGGTSETSPAAPLVDATVDPTVDPAGAPIGGSAPTTADVAFDSVAELVATNAQFSILASLLEEADLVEEWAGPGPLTVLAPTDAAFAALPADLLAAVRQDPSTLADVLRHHVVAGEVTTADLADGATLEALDGATLTVASGDGTWEVGGAALVDPDLRAGNGVVHAVDAVLVPETAEIDPTATAIVRAVLDDGRVVLAGTVRDDAQRQVLTDAVLASRAPESLVDELEVDAGLALPAATVEALASVVDVMPSTLTTGVAGTDGSGVFVRGEHLGVAAAATLSAAAQAVGADIELDQRPVATAADVTALQARLDDVVTTTPITFEPRGSELAPGAGAVLDRLAAIAGRFDGVRVTVEGYTDTGGSTEDNQVLSEARAEAVRSALEARGVPAGQLAAVGFGESAPIVVDGVEDAAASRRIELRAELTAGAGGSG